MTDFRLYEFTARASFSEQPKENGQKCADKQASNDREMKTEVSPAVMNITRQSAQPVFAESRPEQQADARDDQAEDKQKFAQLIHDSTYKIAYILETNC